MGHVDEIEGQQGRAALVENPDVAVERSAVDSEIDIALLGETTRCARAEEDNLRDPAFSRLIDDERSYLFSQAVGIHADP